MQVFSVPPYCFLSKTQEIRLFVAVSVSFACFPAFEDSLTNFKQSKEKEKKVSPRWCLNDKSIWQGGAERACACAKAFRSTHPSVVHRQEARTSAPHLPRYQNTSSPDKLECVRARSFLTSQVSVTFLSSCWFFHGDKETQNEPSCRLSFSLSSCPFSPLGIVEWSRNMEQKSTSHAA